MTTDRHPIDDAPLPDGLHDDEHPAADDDESMALCATCGIDFEPTGYAQFLCRECSYDEGFL